MCGDAGPLTRIEEYRFGAIRLDAGTFTTDLILWPGRVRDNWWRRSGHSLCLDDLKEVMADPPSRLLVGTGYHGIMKVPADLRARLEESGTALTAVATTEAVDIWNRWLDEEGAALDAVAAFHLTC